MIKSWLFADNFSRLPIKRLDNEHLVFWWLSPPPPHRSVPSELIGTFSAGVQFSRVLGYKEWHSESSIIHHHAVFPALPPSNYTTRLLMEWFTLCHSHGVWFASPGTLVPFPSAGMVWLRPRIRKQSAMKSLPALWCSLQSLTWALFHSAFSPIKRDYNSLPPPWIVVKMK